MPAALLPADEADRVAALGALDIVGTRRNPEFDIFPSLASQLFGTPVAAISLVESDRQWFKASVGLDVDETPRSVSFCAHAILAPGELLYVPDAREDPRFADNALVLGPFGLRFYAGCPIIGPSGHAVGAICVIDRKPRTVDDAVLDRLRQLALGVESALRLHESVKTMQELAYHDPLTGLLNRAGFHERLRHAFASRHDGRHQCFGLLFLDLDRFKSMNDLFGHGGGDAGLREVAARLRRTVRSADAVSRYGGDEFCIFLQGLDETELLDLAEQIHAAFARPFQINHQTVPLQTSIGVAVGSAHDTTAEELIGEADRALYCAKRAGRGTTRLAPDRLAPGPGAALWPAKVGRALMEETLRHVLIPAGHEPFAVALQPLFAAQAGRLCGFEALVRWPQPDGQVLPPDEFIPVAEATGLVVELDRWVLNEACRLAAGWPQDDLFVSCNLSAANFLAGGLVEAVQSALARHRLAPEQLQLEITESALLHNLAHVQS